MKPRAYKKQTFGDSVIFIIKSTDCYVLIEPTLKDIVADHYRINGSSITHIESTLAVGNKSFDWNSFTSPIPEEITAHQKVFREITPKDEIPIEQLLTYQDTGLREFIKELIYER